MNLNKFLLAALACSGSAAAMATGISTSQQTHTMPVPDVSNMTVLEDNAASKSGTVKGKTKKPVGYQISGQSLPLPGIGLIPGAAKPEQENNVIRITSNKTEVVDVSATLTNRIATPFANPKAILLDGGATVTADGQSLYVALDGSPNPVALYVTGSDSNDPVVSLTLMPQSLTQQTIVLQLDGLDKTSSNRQPGREENSNSPIYTERLVSILRSVALGDTPEGFVQGRLPLAAANLGNFTAIPLSRFSSSSYDVYRYRLVTDSRTTIELEEAAFASQGVRAVAFFPSALIAKDVSTEVYVVADKKATVQGVGK